MPDAAGAYLLDTFDGAPITVRRTRRKNSIEISIRDGKVNVLAPQRVPEGEIRALIAAKQSWIRAKLQRQAALPQVAAREFVDGERFLFLGEAYPLRVLDGPKANAELEQGTFVVHARRAQTQERRARSIRAAFLRWYKAEAAALFADRTDHFARLMGAAPRRISFRDYKSMWGKCTGGGEITYNWKLVMAPPEIADYVVVHELAHLHHLNHSKDFWRCVEAVIPDHKARRKWLKDYGQALVI